MSDTLQPPPSPSAIRDELKRAVEFEIDEEERKESGSKRKKSKKPKKPEAETPAGKGAPEDAKTSSAEGD